MRLFVALDLPWALRARLLGLAARLPNTRWVPPENLHLTLRFIGEVAAHTADEIDQALAAIDVAQFPIELAGVGISERHGQPSSLWAAVRRQPALDHLQQKIERSLQSAGLPAERRRFKPHVTLARLGGLPDAGVAAWIQQHNLFRSEAIRIESFTLFRSRLGKEQAAYIAEVEYELLEVREADVV